MSKLIDRLQQLTQSAPQAMGFRTSQAVSPKHRIQLMAYLISADIDHLPDYASGADAVLLPITSIGSGSETLQRGQQAIPQTPCGGWLMKPEKEAKARTSQIDTDFIVFPARSTLPAILENKATGKILEVLPSLDEGLLPAITQLPVDAVLIASAEPAANSLTWYDLMVFQWFASVLTKPLLAVVPQGVSGAELQALWKAGVIGIVVAVDTAKSAMRFKQLRQEIDQLEFPAPQKRNMLTALLPRSRVTEGDAGEESDD